MKITDGFKVYQINLEGYCYYRFSESVWYFRSQDGRTMNRCGPVNTKNLEEEFQEEISRVSMRHWY